MKNFSRDALRLFLVRGIGAGLLLVTQLLLVQIVGAERTGALFLYTALVGAIGLLTEFGLVSSAEKRVSEDTGRPYFATVIAIRVAGLVLLAPILWFARDAIAGLVGLGFAWVLLGVALNQTGILVTAVYTGERRFGALAKLDILQGGVQSALLVAVALNGGALEHLVLAHLASHAVLLLGVIGIPGHLRAPSREAARSVWRFARYGVLNGPMMLAYRWYPTLVIGALVGPAAVAYWEIGLSLTSAILMVSYSFGTLLLPMTSVWVREGAISTLRKAIETSVVYLSLAAIPALVLFTLEGQAVSALLGIGAATGAALLLAILSLERWLQGFVQVLTRVTFGFDAPRTVLASGLTGAGVIVLLVPFLAPAAGLPGAAVALTLGTAASLAILAASALRRGVLALPVRILGWITGASLVAGALAHVTWLLPLALEGPGRTLVAVGTFLAAAGGLCLAHRGIRSQILTVILPEKPVEKPLTQEVV